jgi:hypothetical protein
MERRPVIVIKMRHVGKEANELERVDPGLVHELDEVLTVYERDRSGELREELRRMAVKEAIALTGLSRRQVHYLRSGQRKPSPACLDAMLPSTSSSVRR